MAQVNPETALGEGNVSGRTIGTAASRRRASLAKSISVLVAKTQTGGYKLEVDPLMPLVISSGVVLAACAGMVNAIAFETSETLVSHVTGAVSKVSLHTVGEHAHAGKMVLLVSFFLLGSMISGCIIKRTAVKMAYMGYGVAMTASALLLISSLLVFKASEDAAVYILCVACGLQNGIMSSYTGSVIRTTHMTGIVTDVGLITGRHLVSCFKRKCCHKIPFADEEPGETRKLILLLLLLLSFLLRAAEWPGVAAGSGLARALHELSLLVPAAIALMAGTGYMLWTYLRDDIQDEVKILQAEGKTSSSSPKSPVSPSVQPLKAVDAEATDQPCSPAESLAPPTADDVDP